MTDTTRLAAPWGSRIDRARPVSFTFDGRRHVGLDGDTVASALLAEGKWILSRSFKYHRPRGPLTMAGQDANTLVQVGAEPNVRADRRRLAEGLAVTAQNTSRSAEHDRGALLDRLGRFLPVGFYYRGFFGPTRRSWLKLWEPMIRRAAGLGEVDPDQAPGRYEKCTLHCDVMVVGGGPAGMAAARTAAEAGADVVLVEAEPETGGALTHGRYAPETLAKARAELESSGARLLTGATCNGWYADNYLPVLQGDRLIRVRAGEVIVATGTQEQPLVFRNNDLPGIVTASAAQRLLRHYAVRPGRRAVVYAGTPTGLEAALDLGDAGTQVAAILVPVDGALPPDLVEETLKRGFRLLQRATVREALGGRGHRHIRALRVTGPAGEEVIACDLAVIAAGATPAYQLPLHAGARLGFDDERQSFTLSDLPAHMHLAGAVSGLYGLEAVIRSGEIAGASAARALGLEVAIPAPLPDDVAGFHRTVPVPAPDPRGRDFVDFDEDLQVKDIVNAVADGYRELELVKRYSTVGMGPSQGRHSALATARIVASETRRSVGEVGITTARPPFGPEKLGLLAGPVRTRYRLTPMDPAHRQAGAVMGPVGAWWRPLYHGAPRHAASAIADEVRAVREGVAMLDVSTLGKLAIRGPDAGAFLDRIYTMAHAKQPVGRVRYCLMLNEMGSVIDDGVAYRVAEDDFYVTATTGAVDRVFSDMLWWNAQWRMNVDIQNITAAFAGINVTGPLARLVLQALDGDIDLSGDAFGFLGGRSGHLAGCPVRIMRIGFTGELSFELHTPRSYGPALWAALTRAGRAHGLRPYGLEASRILRLEKGHIIIGQDTDALSTPDELGMGWALSKKKPFFVGRAAVEARRRAGQRRALCRFEMTAESGADISESCLVIREGDPVGHITSVARSPTLGRVIGLAYAHPDDVRAGADIRLRGRSGREVEATLVDHAYYDPENRRQET